jgi:hypothetical protein
MLGQDLAYEFCQFRITSDGKPHFPTPQRASQIGGSLAAPLIKSKLVRRAFKKQGGPASFEITPEGRAELRR